MKETAGNETAGIQAPKDAERLVLVPNQRIRERCLARRFRQPGAPDVQVAPPVAVLSQWVADTAMRLDLLAGDAPPAGVSPLAIQVAWFEEVSGEDAPPDAARRRLLARRARAADRELRHWLAADTATGLDPRFRQWRRAVRTRFGRAGLATPEDWLERLAARLESDTAITARLPRRLVLHGFVEITRLERRLLDALEARGTAVETRTDTAPAAGAVTQRVFDDPASELRAAARWAEDRYRRGYRNIAVVVNGLDSIRADIRPIFDRALSPANPDPASGAPPGWHLPGGSRLREHALIADALLLLSTALHGSRHAWPFPRISRLLLSPCIAGTDIERAARAQFERRLREMGRYRQSLAGVSRLLRAGALADGLPVLGRLLARPPAIGAGQDTARAFSDCLAAWGWPGPLATGVFAATLVGRFATLLEDLRGSGLPAGPEALVWLEQACRETPVTERGGPLSPIQLLALEDAVGDAFDAAWIANLHADNWPGTPLGNPFLPAAARQRIPRASAEGELAYTHRLHAQLTGLAPEIVCSWARQGGDAPRLPSPLVLAGTDTESDPSEAHARLPAWPDAGGDAGLTTDGNTGHSWLDVVVDAPGRALDDTSDRHLPGGAGMVRDQSACPFAAYLRYRLQADFAPMPGPFADAAYRGQLLHAALEALFREQAGGAGLPQPAAVTDAVDRALGVARAARRLSTAGIQAERERLCRLLREWLEFEGGRAAVRVAAVEVRHEFTWRGFTLTGRVDRVDRLADGRLLIIDYKSGLTSVTDWAEPRPRQPQLPLYMVLLEGVGDASIGGLALAQVRAGDCGFAGIVDDPDAAHDRLYDVGSGRYGLARQFGNWAELRRHFDAAVGSLLDEIIAGRADNVAYHPEALAWTGLEPVLRHGEGAAWLTARGAHLAEDAHD